MKKVYFEDFKENLEKQESNGLSGMIIKAFHDLNVIIKTESMPSLTTSKIGKSLVAQTL